MKYYKPLAWMMAIAIASTTMTACSSDDNETEKPFTTDPVESSMLYACGVGQSETRSVADAQNVLFTEDDIDSIWATMPCLWSAVSSVTGIVGYSPTLSCIMM